MNQFLQNFQKYYQALNPEQRAAVDAIEGPVMVIAGAGTGKTQILAVRIAKILLETQIDPYNILCLTFTDAGVAAMRKRLIEIIGPTAYHIKVCTFHSFCNEIIKENPEEFLFSRDFSQIDDLDKILLLREIIDELGVRSPIRPHGDPYYYQFDLESRIKDLKKENFTPELFQIRIGELAHFLKHFEPLINPFCQIKGSPKEEEINAVSPENIFPKLTAALQKDSGRTAHLIAACLNFYQNCWDNYQKSLTGEKRPDGTRRTAFKNAVKDFISRAVKDLPKQEELARAYLLYQNKLKEKSWYDYEDMILFVSQRFAADSQKPDGGLLRKYQEQFQYLLVDEYQDTNSAQNQTVELLGNYFEAPNLFVVGDDDQSIYRFQGASIENIIDFHKRYTSSQSGELKLVTLIKNYRSQQTILDASGKLIANNRTRIANYLPEIDKSLKSATEKSPAKLQLSVFETENTENFGIAKTIEKLIAEGTNPKEIAVLYRSHQHSEDLIELLLKLQIPFEIKAGNDILKDLEIGKLIRLFKAIENPNDNELLVQAMFLDFLKINKQDLLKLSHFYFVSRLEKQHYSLFQILSLPKILSEARIEDPARLQKFARLITDLKEASENETLSAFFERVIKESHFLEHLLESKTRLEGLNRLNTLFKEIKNLTRKNHQSTIAQFLEQLQLRAENRLKLNEEPLQTNRDAVQLMTAHGSKGLEFENVFIIKCTNKAWGNNKNRDNIRLPKGLVKSEILDEKLENEEDERRLFYVAVTRAKDQVHFSYAKFRSEQNKQKEDLPALFLNEIPTELLETVDTAALENQALAQLETIFFTPPETGLDFNNGLIKKLAEDHVISPTSLNNYLTCPRKFFYQNLIRIPQARNKSAAMGSAIHAALNDYFRKYFKTKVKPPREALTLPYKKYLERELLTDQDFRERLEIGQNILNDYYDSQSEDFSSETVTEYNFASHGVNIDGIRITGKIDKIVPEKANPRELIITDFKTGNADSAQQRCRPGEDYWRQVIFYKILCDNSPEFKKRFSSGAMALGRLEFLEKSRSKKDYLITAIDLSSAAIDEVKNSIKSSHQRILNLDFEKIEKSDPCNRCPFYNLCWKN